MLKRVGERAVKRRESTLPAGTLDFAPQILKLQHQPPSPLPKATLYTLFTLFLILIAWCIFGRLDIVAVAHGKLVPQTYVKIVQPSESGIIADILVNEGEKVRAGQVLMRMDAVLSAADSRALRTELAQRALQLRRIDAELSGAPLQGVPHDIPELFRQVEAQYFANQQARRDALDVERAVLAKAREDLASALEIQTKLKQTLPGYIEQAQAYTKLGRKNLVGKLEVLDRQGARIEVEQDLRAQDHNVSGLEAAIAQSEQRLGQIVSDTDQRLQMERIKTYEQQQKLKAQWSKQQHRNTLLQLKAPQAGVVKDLATHTRGTVVQPGTVLMTLVPVDDPLTAEVWVSNQDIGFVHRGQAVKVKLASFPFQHYGMVNGVLAQINADATDKPGLPDESGQQDELSSQSEPSGELFYKTLVRLGSQHLNSGEERYALTPGMQVDAEIKLGTRRVIEYLLSPITKAFLEAGREL